MLPLGLVVLIAVACAFIVARRRRLVLNNALTGLKAEVASVIDPTLEQSKPKKQGCEIHVKASTFTTVVPAPPSPLLTLYEELCLAFAEAQHGLPEGVPINNSQPAESFCALDARVRSLMGTYAAAGHSDWRSCCAFNSHHYVRHLVDANETFELMLICWKGGQASSVHDHADSHCWLTVLQGAVDEVQWVPQKVHAGTESTASSCNDTATAPEVLPGVPGVLGSTRPCPKLRQTCTSTLPSGATSYISDLLALHAVSCLESCPGEGAVTLHLYAPPIRRVNLYQPDEDRVVQRVPGFFSFRGQNTNA